MEKWSPSRLLWKRVSTRGKPLGGGGGPERVGWAVFHRPLPFPTAAKQRPGPTFPQALLRDHFILQNPFLFLTQPDISLAIKSGHFHLLITAKILPLNFYREFVLKN